MVFYLACGDYWRSRHFILWFACSFWSYQQDSDSQKEKDERCLTSRRSQPPLARSVPLSRFTSRVGGGSAFFVRPCDLCEHQRLFYTRCHFRVYGFVALSSSVLFHIFPD